jgi:hypothetical protein
MLAMSMAPHQLVSLRAPVIMQGAAAVSAEQRIMKDLTACHGWDIVPVIRSILSGKIVSERVRWISPDERSLRCFGRRLKAWPCSL